MILDLEQERKNGLDESKLAEQVMRLMGLSETCEGPIDRCSNLGLPAWFTCVACAANGYAVTSPHPRVPKPLHEVRDELLTWLIRHDGKFTLGYFSDGNGVLLNAVTENSKNNEATYVQFAKIEDEGLALALAAVRLLGEKQDDSPVSSMPGL